MAFAALRQGISLLNFNHFTPVIAASSCIHTTSALCGEPQKKKKKLDPAIAKMQAERKKRRLEKQIKRAKKFSRKLKPVDEFELHRLIPKNAESSRNPDTIEMTEEISRRREIELEWSTYRLIQNRDLHFKFTNMLRSQEIALTELKLENQELFEMAVQRDDSQLLLSFNGPCETPPKPDYMQDGQYTETTKSYELDPKLVQRMLEVQGKKA